MRILDRYILKHFIQNFLFGILCFLVIFVLVDLFENLDKFIDRHLAISRVIEYYIYFTPEILKLIVPVAVLLASLFTVSRFVNYSELTAMKSAGISIYRYIAPILIFGMLITGFSIYFNGWLVPKSNTKKFNFEREVLGRNLITTNISNLYIQDKTNRIISIISYDRSQMVCYGVSIQVFNKDTLNKLEYRLDTREMKWDSEKNDWVLKDYYQRDFTKSNSEVLKFSNRNYISEIDIIRKINITPDLIIKRIQTPEELNLSEFYVYVQNLRESGQESARAEVNYYSIISFPFASLVTIIFGVAVSSNKRKGGAALQFGISLLVSFFYLGFVKISQVFGYNGELPPILTAWLANILFLIVSFLNFYRINRY